MNPGETPRTPSSGPGAPGGLPPLIPNYELLRCIGHGSYGEVWLARNVLGTFCAVKVVWHSASPDEDRPYAREFEGIRRFEPVSKSHPSQISILHVGRDPADAFFYYVLELGDDQLTGQQIDPASYQPKTLRSEMKRRGRLPPGECLDLLLALTQALEHLHAHGLIHRDIKPANVIFVHGRPKLADIGLVTAAAGEHSFVGTEGYVPNEGPGKPADIFALGKILYEMNTGLGRDKYPSLPDDAGKVPEPLAVELNQVVNRACDPSVQRRYQSAAELREDLEFLKSRKSLVLKRRLSRAMRAVAIATGIAVATGVLAALATGFFWYKLRGAEAGRREDVANLRAEEQRKVAEKADRQKALRELKIARWDLPRDGWFAEGWSNLQHLATLKLDQQVMDEASAMIAGLDVIERVEHTHYAASAAAFAPDGRVVMCGLETNAAVMDANGQLTLQPVLGNGPVCWTPEGVPLLLTRETNRLVLYEVESGRERRAFDLLPSPERLPGSPSVLALAQDGGLIAAGWGNRVLVWDAVTGQLRGPIATNATALAFSPDGSLLAIGANDGRTHIYSVPNLALVYSFGPQGRPNGIRSLAFGRDSTVPDTDGQRNRSWLLAAGDGGAQVFVWDLQRGIMRRPLFGALWTVNSLAFHPSGLYLAAVGQSAGKLWDVATGREVLRLYVTGVAQARVVTFDTTGTNLLCGGEWHEDAKHATLTRSEVVLHQGILALRGLSGAVRRVWLSPTGKRVAAIADNWELGVWDIEADRMLYRFETPRGDTADAAGGCFSPDAEEFWFAAGNEACRFDLRTGAIRQRWELRGGACSRMQVDPHGMPLLLRREETPESGRHIWRLYNLGGERVPNFLQEQPDRSWSARWMAFAPGGEHFLVWNGWPWETEQILHVYSSTNGNELRQIKTGLKNGDLNVVFDPQGRFFAHQTSTDLLPFPIVRFSDFSRLGHTRPGCQSIGPNCEQVVGGDHWRLYRSGETQDLPIQTDWHENSFVSEFSRDGQRLAMGTEEGIVLVAELAKVSEWIDRLGSSAKRR